MAFLDDLFGNKTEAPQQTIVPIGQQLSNAYSTATSLMPQLTAYNNGLVNQQLNAQNGIFGPAANQLQRGSYQSILDSLNLGSSIDPALQEQLTTNYLQGNAASGLGTSAAGRMFAADNGRQFGQALLRQRQQDALGAAIQLPSSKFTPSAGFDLGSIANAESANQAAIDNQANIARNVELERQNAFQTKLYQAAGMIGGAAVGYFTKDPSAIQKGLEFGTALAPKAGVAGYGNQTPQIAQGNPDYASILTGISGMFGGMGGNGRSVNWAGGDFNRPGAFGSGGFGQMGYA